MCVKTKIHYFKWKLCNALIDLCVPNLISRNIRIQIHVTI